MLSSETPEPDEAMDGDVEPSMPQKVGEVGGLSDILGGLESEYDGRQRGAGGGSGVRGCMGSDPVELSERDDSAAEPAAATGSAKAVGWSEAVRE